MYTDDPRFSQTRKTSLPLIKSYLTAFAFLRICFRKMTELAKRISHLTMLASAAKNPASSLLVPSSDLLLTETESRLLMSLLSNSVKAKESPAAPEESKAGDRK